MTPPTRFGPVTNTAPPSGLATNPVAPPAGPKLRTHNCAPAAAGEPPTRAAGLLADGGTTALQPIPTKLASTPAAIMPAASLPRPPRPPDDIIPALGPAFGRHLAP